MDRSKGSSKLEMVEARIEDIEARQKELDRNRKGYFRFFVAVPIVSALAFAWGTWLGAAVFFTGILVCVFGFYTVIVRAGEYRRELVDLEQAVVSLRQRDEPKAKA